MNIIWTDVKTFFINQNEVTKIQLNGTTLWQKSSGPTPGPDYTEPFYIEDLSGSSNRTTISKASSSSLTLTIEVSEDKTNWTNIGTTDSGVVINIPANGKVYIRSNNTGWSYSQSAYNYFSNPRGLCKIGGNIMSLLYGEYFTGQETTFSYNRDYMFYRMFSYNRSITDASDLLLPATSLTAWCYSNMFLECSGITQAPALPATTLQPDCYREMFKYCTSLTTAPALPATTLAEYCYYSMFESTTITTAPDLLATTLVDGCYGRMFNGSRNLNYIKCLATDISANYCTSLWVNSVSATGTFVKDASMSSWTTGDYGIPTGWTVEDAS